MKNPPDSTPAAETDAPVIPTLNHETAVCVVQARRHHKSSQTVWWHDQGWAFTYTGVPIAPLTEKEIADEAEALAKKKQREEAAAAEKAAQEKAPADKAAAAPVAAAPDAAAPEVETPFTKGAKQKPAPAKTA